jgi:hypothetical protein
LALALGGNPDRIAPDEPATDARRAERRRARRRAVALRRRNALIAVAAMAFLAGVVAGAGGDGGGSTGADAAKAGEKPGSTLPGGGRRIIPGRHVVALYGAPQDAELGALGIGSPDAAARRLQRQTRAYRSRSTRELPAMELIAVVANRAPGDDGRYRTRLDDAVIGRYLRAARKVGAILVLDIQPGRSDFLTEAKALRRWLAEPDVSLALDPEWRMQEGQIPGQAIGSVSAQEVNSVARWLSAEARRDRLPQKLLVVHQFTRNMVRDRDTLERPPGVMPVLNVDGFGDQAQKQAKYRELAQRRLPNGFKLFYKEDRGLMAPRAVEALSPRPQFVVYE